MLKEVGVDAVNIADSPMARVRMSCARHGVPREAASRAGDDPALHHPRPKPDGLQSELMGAHAVGIRNHTGPDGRPTATGRLPGRHRGL